QAQAKSLTACLHPSGKDLTSQPLARCATARRQQGLCKKLRAGLSTCKVRSQGRGGYPTGASALNIRCRNIITTTSSSSSSSSSRDPRGGICGASVDYSEGHNQQEEDLRFLRQAQASLRRLR
ncbi:unnamed protein product, partial [Pylaiella littoralis]